MIFLLCGILGKRATDLSSRGLLQVRSSASQESWELSLPMTALAPCSFDPLALWSSVLKTSLNIIWLSVNKSALISDWQVF